MTWCSFACVLQFLEQGLLRQRLPFSADFPELEQSFDTELGKVTLSYAQHHSDRLVHFRHIERSSHGRSPSFRSGLVCPSIIPDGHSALAHCREDRNFALFVSPRRPPAMP